MAAAKDHRTTMLEKYPWLSMPLICNAPMGGIATHKLAIPVSHAGGFGWIGEPMSAPKVDEYLTAAAAEFQRTPRGTLPVGLGVLCFLHRDIAADIAAIAKHKPAAVWLFAPHGVEQYKEWAEALRAHDECKDVDLWIQVGTVREAVEVVQACQPDVLVVQGADAGGHGLDDRAGVISLVPEVRSALDRGRWADVPVVAAGGIAEGRGVAASVCLGAVGAAMGTRFLACEETGVPHKGYVDAILAASDGGQSTASGKLFDDLHVKGNIWPGDYGGRALKNASWADAESGLSIEENRRLHHEAEKGEGAGHGVGIAERRTNVWAGTAVGLIERVESATSLVENTRSSARSVLGRSQL